MPFYSSPWALAFLSRQRICSFAEAAIAPFMAARPWQRKIRASPEQASALGIRTQVALPHWRRCKPRTRFLSTEAITRQGWKRRVISWLYRDRPRNLVEDRLHKSRNMSLQGVLRILHLSWVIWPSISLTLASRCALWWLLGSLRRQINQWDSRMEAARPWKFIPWLTGRTFSQLKMGMFMLAILNGIQNAEEFTDCILTMTAISWLIRNCYQAPHEIVEVGAHLGVRGSAARRPGTDDVGKLVGARFI